MIASLNNFDKIINSLIFNRQKHLLFLTIIIGSFLRFYNLNWDGGYQGHPDESNLVKASVGLDIPNQLDPRFYSYGGFLMYSMRIVSETLHILTGNSEWITSAAAMTVSGRIVTALCSSISIYLIYVLLKYFFSKRFALVGAILMSFSVGFIQYSKYAISDAPLFMSLLIIAIFTARVIQNNTIKNWTSLGISCGLGLSIKSTSISFLILPIIAWLITFPDKSNLKYLIYKSIVLTSTLLIIKLLLKP
jgi:4-amino-4-deoxy-L-arabinose transferase-like glycosyltransferase